MSQDTRHAFWNREKRPGILDQMPRACHCVGPRPGEPLCPSQMRNVIVRDGRYIQPERDLGPVKPSLSDDDARHILAGFYGSYE